ncbi:inactive TPR repeat-containing thioredoxin TTL3-like [Lycium barbarum]|uniref:inactive TPR repeat-containing thioredoxin TTL3-like n=1 Tax=Lycium barbarum TaxID=112863 RepID=UPI00293ED17F|nr:inactive TPR repeat-containing thioredoxin TTL3-like [Lycium barbarum]
MEKTRKSSQSTMSRIVDNSVEHELGCGLIGAFFPRRNINRNKSTVPPIPTKSRYTNVVKNSRRCHDSSYPKNSNKASFNLSSVNKMSQVVNLAYTQKLRREPTFTSSDLSMTIFSHRKSRPNIPLNHGSTGNITQLGHLGNLNKSSSRDKKTSTVRSHQSGSFFRGSANKLDPDVLKTIGNEKYRRGKFEEALALYNQAIAIDSRNACYYSNKSAALMSLGRLIEAVVACREAIQLYPSYHNAHCRLARLYLRLGDAEKAIDHYKQSGRKVDKKDISEAHDLKRQIIKCTEAKKLRDYNTLLKETKNSISLGADSAPQVFAMRAEALMKLHRHDEAYTTIQNGPDFKTELYASLFGSAKTAYFLITRAEAYATVGRFTDAIAAAQEAAKLDQSNEVINTILRRIKRLGSARLKGNELFRENKFSEAFSVYTEGLEQEPYNSVLLFNRAACRFKLRQFEKAVEDCTAALLLRPSYTKARLRRADYNIKLERWKLAIQDCEVLIQENPEDDEVNRVFSEAKVQLQKQLEEDHNQRN